MAVINESGVYALIMRSNKPEAKKFRKWILRQCQDVGRALTGYCRGKHIEIQKCQTNDERFGAVNSYPDYAWAAFLNETGMREARKTA
jgi:prophage antirepressor-like protein